MIPTERPVRAVERQRLTICLRISPFQPSLTPETTRAAHQHATLARIAAPSALLVFRMPPNRMFPLIRRRPVQTVSTIPRIEAHGALRTERCHGRCAVGVERPVRLSARAAQRGKKRPRATRAAADKERQRRATGRRAPQPAISAAVCVTAVADRDADRSLWFAAAGGRGWRAHSNHAEPAR